MALKTTHNYILRALTHMHAGSGDSTYGVIDNLVQRDPKDGFPVIHASALKGALKEHFKDHHWQENSAAIMAIFGYGSQEINRDKTRPRNGNSVNSEGAGTYDFHQASLLSIPVRSDKVPYLCATTPFVLRTYLDFLEQTSAREWDAVRSKLKSLADKTEIELAQPIVFEAELAGAIVEEFDLKTVYQPHPSAGWLSKLLGPNPVLVSGEHFRYFTDNLPTVARNFLDNGESKNLWYEQIVPAESRFYTTVIAQQDHLDLFTRTLDGPSLVQIGGNATVGYGKTRFLSLSKLI
jgi:CRISPR-associated protein Cmr4